MTCPDCNEEITGESVEHDVPLHPWCSEARERKMFADLKPYMEDSGLEKRLQGEKQ